MKSVKDIDALKANWLSDPIWDIEKTEGFEDHKEELLAFRKEQEEKWEAIRQQRITDTKNATGVDAHTARFIKTFKEIELSLELDHAVGDCDSAVANAEFEISRAQVRATLLLAAQVMRVADYLQEAKEYDKYIRGN